MVASLQSFADSPGEFSGLLTLLFGMLFIVIFPYTLGVILAYRGLSRASHKMLWSGLGTVAYLPDSNVCRRYFITSGDLILCL
jgi:hypothetical protein